MGGGSTTTDYSSLPVYGDQADLDYAVRTGQIGGGDRARMGNSIYEYDREGGWQRIRTLPPGTFADATTGSTPGILNPLPTVNDGILNPSPTGGITDPNYKSLGEFLVGPTYTGPTTADEYVMQRAGGPAWDYDYPMYLGAGVYGPGGSIPTVTSTGDWTTTTPITDTTIDTTTDTTTTTTTDDDDTIIREGPDVRDGRVGPEYGWEPGQTDPIFPNTWPGIVNYNQRVEDMGPVEAFGLLEGLQRTGQGLGGFVDPSAPYASLLSPENFNPLSLGGAGDPGWAPESTIQQEVWGEDGTHSTFDPVSGKMINVQHFRGQPKGSSFLGMIGNAFAKTEGSKAWSPEKVKSVQQQVAAQPTTPSNVQQVIDIPSNVTWSPAAQPVAPQTAPQVAPVADIGLQVAQQQQAVQQALAEDAARNTRAARAIMASRAYQESAGNISPQEQAIMDR